MKSILPKQENQRSLKRNNMASTQIGKVISTKMQKTIVVEVSSTIKHPLYKKLIKRTRTFKAHDEIGVKVGQEIKIGESKKYSKDVHFKVLEVIE